MTSELLLPPGVLIASGNIGTGKTTVLQEAARHIRNSVYLEKDAINQAGLRNPAAWLSGLPSAQTFLGEMDEHFPGGDYYNEHVRDQSYLVMAAQAKTNLELGKLVIIDTIPGYMIRDGRLKGLMAYLAPYPSYLIHFVADEDECYRRLVERAAHDPYKRLKDRERIASREAFHYYATVTEPMYPEEHLRDYPHKRLDTTNQTPQESALSCLDYIKWLLT